MKPKSISSWHVGGAAEAYAAAMFARYGYYVSVQYGANQPEYDLIAESEREPHMGSSGNGRRNNRSDSGQMDPFRGTIERDVRYYLRMILHSAAVFHRLQCYLP